MSQKLSSHQSRVDFAYSFAPPHRLTVGRPEASERTLLDLEPGSLRMAWSYEDLTDVKRYPLAAFKVPPVNWEVRITATMDGDQLKDSRWNRVDGWLPALDNTYTGKGGMIRFQVYGCRTAAVAQVTVENRSRKPHRFTLLCERPGGWTGTNLAWVDPTRWNGDHLIAGWMERADRIRCWGLGRRLTHWSRGKNHRDRLLW